MALDFTKIAPAALVRLLNSTRLGPCITERQLYRHRMEAGLRIGDAKHIHLLRYSGWLARQLDKHDQQEARMPTNKQRQYDEHKQRAAKRQAEIAEAGQEIGPPPAVVNPDRREACRYDLKLFCETYFPQIFYKVWSPDHLKALKKLEQAILEGKLFSFAMPRGSGKTVLCIVAVIWAAVYGHHKYISLIAATERMARKLLEKIYNSLERNEKLFEDFPEVCYPVRQLERTPQRAMKQKCQGQYTYMLWTKREIVLPTIVIEKSPAKKFSPASGTIISVCGLTGGEVRGQNKDMPDGSIARPSLVLLDDPQTKASAKSPTQCQDRLELLQGDVLGMAGPDKNIAGMMPCTVIRPGDMADEILDPEKHPEWHGERTKMVYNWPDNEALWEEYVNLRSSGLRSGDSGFAATEFYRQHRAAMDAGAKIAWPEGFPPDCVSAIQHAMNLKMRDEAAFFAEYQNEPLVAKEEDDQLDSDQIAAKLNRRAEAAVPTSCTKVVMFVDVQKKLLYYSIIALEPNFTAYLIEYGSWPDQRLHYFAYREARKTLTIAHKGHGEEAAIHAGLEELTAVKLAKSWMRDDGAPLRVSTCLIDSGYQKDTVELFCRQSKFAGVVIPSKGLPITAASMPLEERKRKKGEEVGDGWRLTGRQGEHSVRLMLFDANHWKSFLHARLAVPIGDRGCLSLWGSSQARHRMLAEHLTAEFRVRTEGRGRKVDEWKERPGRDNHLLDCCSGCMVAASYQGCRILGEVVPRKGPVKRRSLKDMKG